MIQKSILLLFILTFSLLNIYCQNEKEVIIEGKVNFNTDSEIRIIGFSDYITAEPHILASNKIKKNGDFKLSFKISKIELIQIAIFNAKAEFFAVPGHHYNLICDINLDDLKQFNPEQYDSWLQITSPTIDTNDLNYKINTFSSTYQSLLYENSYAIYYLKDKKAYDTLCKQIKAQFPVEYQPDNFYKSYIYYTLGEIESVIYAKSPKKLYEKYFDNDHILYDNPAYISLFYQFYNNYLYNSPRISKSDLAKYINEEPSYPNLFNATGSDFMLVNERVRELAIIFGLGSLISDEEFDTGNIYKLLEYIKKNTHFKEHIRFIDNLIFKIKKLESGAKIQTATFETPLGTNFTLSKLKGKYVYVQIFSTQCMPCLREMPILQELHNKYKEEVNFISLSVDFDKSDFEQFCIQYPEFNWTFLHFNNQYEWFNQLEINSLPDYIMFAPDGSLYQRNPPAPEKELSLFLLRLFPPNEEKFDNPMFPSNGK